MNASIDANGIVLLSWASAEYQVLLDSMQCVCQALFLLVSPPGQRPWSSLARGTFGSMHCLSLPPPVLGPWSP